ncbi:MAG: hypothetical protein HOF21_14050 [Nitrospina sp.]|jgi:hypothetical protein|nr:hypothetical protein [Nitrospina sp.]MBT5631615.1 hypothetical protein [Nitrospina sp.]
MSEEVRDFHFNVNVRTGGGSKAKMANNEDSFLRAMEIQELKREKKELLRLEEERLAAAQAPPEATIEPEQISDEVPATQEETEATADVSAEPAPSTQPEIAPVKPPTPPKPAGSFVPGPKPRSDFSAEERAAMLKRAKAHAAEVKANKNK